MKVENGGELGYKYLVEIYFLNVSMDKLVSML